MPEQPNGSVLELERRRWRASLLDTAREVDRPGVKVDVVDLERDELPGAKAGVVGKRDNRLVAILKVRGTGAGETLVAKVFDLLGLQLGACSAVGVGSGVDTVNVRVRGIGRCRGHGYLTIGRRLVGERTG